MLRSAEERGGLAISETWMKRIFYRSRASQELSGIDDINAAIVSLSDERQGGWAHAARAAVLAVCEEFAFVSLSLSKS